MIRFAAHRPAVVWALCVALLVAGAISFSRLPLATRTTVELPRLQVYASLFGAAPEVIETYLTSPLEAAVQGVRGVRTVSSTSNDNQSSLTVELEPNADVQMTRLAILERIELLRKEMPPGVSGPGVTNFVPEGLEEAPLLSLSVSGPYTAGALQQLLRERVSPKLSAVPGIAAVQEQGGSEPGVSVAYDPALLRRVGIAPRLLSEALSGARVVQALGVQANGGKVRSVVLRDQPNALSELEALPIRGPMGRIYRLGELTTIRAEEDARGAFYRINGVPAVTVEVSRHPGADAIKTAARAREVIDAIIPTLPPAVRLRVASDESEDLANELADLSKRGAIAFGAVLVALAIMLRRWRAVALVMGSTAVAIAATALSLYVLNIPANLLTLAGLCMGVGVLVQNALVVVQRLSSAPDTPDGRAAATQQITPAVIGSTLTTGVVLFPFLYLQGDARAAFVPFASAFLLALAWSVFTALIIVPALGRGAAMHKRTWPRMGHWYAVLLGRALRWRAVTLIVTAGVLGVLTWGFIKKVPRSSFGGFGAQRTSLYASLTFPRGSDPQTIDAGMREFEQLVVGRPEVEQVRTRGNGTSAQMNVTFTLDGGYTSVPLELQELLTQRAVLIGGAQVSVGGQGPGFYSGGGGGSMSSFRFKVLGYSYDGTMRIANDLKTRLERLSRVREVRITSGGYFGSGRGTQVTITPDRATMARYNVSAAELGQSVSREVRGPTGSVRVEIGGDELPITVKAMGARDRSLSELEAALVPNVMGAPVRIGDLAWVDEREALSTIRREDQQYLLQVEYEFRGPAKLASRIHNAFVKTLSAPPGYSITDASNSFGFDRDESAKGLWLVFAIGITLVVLAVALVFDSVWGAAMVFLSLPLSLAGVAAAFWITKKAFTREAAVGVILVVGLAVNHAILMVDAALLKRRVKRDAIADAATDATGEAPPIPRRRSLGLDAGEVLRAMLDRSGMIVFVTVASLASLVPLSLGTDVSRIFGAIALATAGGTIAGTLGVLFVLPALLVGRRRRRSSTRVSSAKRARH